MKKTILFALFNLVLLVYGCAYGQAGNWNNYIDARISSSRYYLFNEAYSKFLKNSKQDHNVLRAFDLGSGSGNEDVFLLSKGWQVTGLDIDEKSGEVIRMRAKHFPGEFSFQNTSFVNMDLTGMYDLFYSRASLPFGKKENLESIVNLVSRHTKIGGVFAFTLFGPHTSFVKKGATYAVSQDEIKDLLNKNEFAVDYFLTRNYLSTDLQGHPIEWEIYDIIALKKKSSTMS